MNRESAEQKVEGHTKAAHEEAAHLMLWIHLCTVQQGPRQL